MLLCLIIFLTFEIFFVSHAIKIFLFIVINFFKKFFTHFKTNFFFSGILIFWPDLGFLASLREKNRIGVFIKNINSPNIGRGLSNQNLPKKIDIGYTTIPYDPLIISFSMEQVFGYPSPQLKTSLKYQINKIICLNTGVQINPNRFGIGFVIHQKYYFWKRKINQKEEF